MQTEKRIFEIAEQVQIHPSEPIRSVVTESPESVITVWHVLPGQKVAAHTHPKGQDTWIVTSGQADYFTALVDGKLKTQPVKAGMIVIAHAGQMHGALNTGDQPFQFVSVVAPFEAGFQPLL
jgi:quercetin dioxygenase-like cupin family protein